jgi:cyclophilin family peptidyl-prolyl cis-trans isomerase
MSHAKLNRGRPLRPNAKSVLRQNARPGKIGAWKWMAEFSHAWRRVMRPYVWHALLGTLLSLAFLPGCGGSEVESADATSDTSTVASEDGGASNTPSGYVAFPQVTLETTHGAITLELDTAKAPGTVRNFLSYVENGHYDGTLFHQVEQGYVLMGGGYTEKLQLKAAGRPIRNEAENGLKNAKGTIAMARSADQIDSSTCQFFINLADNPQLDHQELTAEGYGYCVFGRVVDGWDAIDAIAGIPVQPTGEFSALPTETVKIRSAKRLR